jgi:hypothetical protein
MLAGGEVRPEDANKQVGSAIGLTRVRLAQVTRPGNDLGMAGCEAPAAPPRRQGSRRMRGKSKAIGDRGGSSGG